MRVSTDNFKGAKIFHYKNAEDESAEWAPIGELKSDDNFDPTTESKQEFEEGQGPTE